MEKLAIEGGKPVSNHWIPISKPIIGDEEVREVVRVLRSGLFREGELTRRFEEEFREKCGSKYALAVNSGTAALHLAFMTMIKPGDEVIVPSFTFAASVNTIVLAGGRPVFADIEERTFTLDPDDVLEKITSRTVAIEPVHLYGQPADIKALSEIAEDHGLKLVWDA
ncbi:aminotransferase DegT, partial [Candidatus Bathyarchaeota archaeon ex4484_135]